MTAVTGCTVMHLALDPPPPLRRAAEVTDLLRAAALSRLDWTGDDSMLAGKTRAGAPARDGRHVHAHWLPVAAGDMIMGICLWTPAGLSPAETAAVAAVRQVGHRTQVTLLHGSLPAPPALAGPSAEWESLTPFIPARREDRRARRDPGHLPAMIAAETVPRGFPVPAEVTVTGRPSGWSVQRPSRPEPAPPPAWLRIRFPEPVTGPLAIGRLSHFGLGLMVPA